MVASQPAVLWDMDGVLVDTGPLHYETWKEVFAQQKIDYTKEAFESTFGMNNTGVLSRVLGRVPDPEFVARLGGEKETLFRQRIRGRVQPMPGVLTWLQRFQAWGWDQAIASSAPQENIDALLDELNIRGYFNAIAVGGSLPSKPDPAVYLHAARLLNARPADCLVIEDSIQGIHGAKLAGMRVIAVTSSHPAERLNEADLIVPTLESLSPHAVQELVDR